MYTRSGCLARLGLTAQRQAACWGAAWIDVWAFLLEHTDKQCARVARRLQRCWMAAFCQFCMQAGGMLLALTATRLCARLALVLGRTSD